ncbi:hypothetical protein BGZ63DRAFT_380091, partial [Mariannaea sp. PMI_226]
MVTHNRWLLVFIIIYYHDFFLILTSSPASFHSLFLSPFPCQEETPRPDHSPRPSYLGAGFNYGFDQWFAEAGKTGNLSTALSICAVRRRERTRPKKKKAKDFPTHPSGPPSERRGLTPMCPFLF